MTTPTPPDDDRTARLTDEPVTPLVTVRRGAAAQFTPGTIVAGRYRISSILGAGGMGEVYRAEDVKLGQAVALKFLPPALARDPVLLDRLHEEVRVGRQVAHPNVCRIYDIGEWGVAHFVAMEYVDGEDLARLLRRIRRLPHDTAVHIARGMAAGLLAAHAKGIIHRDLKPANVMIDGQGEARISDFGLAIAAEEGSDAALAGTPAYMAPEQLAGAAATIQSDLYALGLVMYEMFTGLRAHTGATPLRTTAADDDDDDDAPEIVTPSSHVHVRDLDPSVERVILRCLERDPALRPRSVREVLDALPGGDALAAAMAAGETPSPRLVAAANVEGSLAPKVAWSWFAGIVALTVVFAFVRASRQALSLQPLEKPAAVTQERAREILRSLGLPEGRREAWGYEWHSEYPVWVATHVPRAERAGRVRRGPPRVAFWLRRFDAPLRPMDGQLLGSDDPPLERGQTTIELDRKGRLYALRADPATEGPPRALDWRPMLEAAGFDAAKLTPVPSAAIPPRYADARAAWRGVYPDDARVPVTIEAAARRGTPVFFSMTGPWNDREAVRRMPFESPALAIFNTSIVIIVTAFACFLAWRNIRSRRFDRQGVVRLAAFVFAIMFAASLLFSTHALDFPHEVGLLQDAASSASFWMVLYSVLYIAIEPYFRRRWPECLVSWVRLLGGNARDPLVGRDLLAGVTAGLLHSTIAASTPGASPTGSLAIFQGTSGALAHLFGGMGRGMLDGLVLTTALVVLTMLLRRRAASAIGLYVVFATGFFLASRSLSVLPILLVLGLILTFVATRLGLLALVATQTVFRWTFFWQMPASVDAWYFTHGVLSLVCVVALAFYAARVAAGVTPATRRSD